jgi:hypothetical protein
MGLPHIVADPTTYDGSSDRRRTSRTKRKFVTQMTPWSAGVASVPFEVVIENISEIGVGLVHDQPLQLGLRHLLTVPRDDDGDSSIVREYTIVRCEKRSDGAYAVGLELCAQHQLIDDSRPRVTSSRLKLLFLAFGVAGLIVASLVPL